MSVIDESPIEEMLNHADAHRRRCQSEFDEFQAIMDDTNLPQYLWPAPIQKLYKGLVQQNSQAQRDFLRIYRSLATQKQPKPAEPEPPPKPDLTYRGPSLFYQTAEISIVDGKTITYIPDNPAAAMLKRGPYGKPAHYMRQLCFTDNCMPEEYAYAFTHNGETFGPSMAILITYTEEEFLRLCQLEIDTNSPHLLDGERVSLQRQA